MDLNLNTCGYKPHIIEGNWNFGIALDLHTSHSTRIDDTHFKTDRTELGELLYQLKYRQDYSKIQPLVNVLSQFVNANMHIYSSSIIISTPPSTPRTVQPVLEIAKGIAQATGLKFDFTYLNKIKNTSQMKNIQDIEYRKNIIDGAFKINDDRYQNMDILLFDDLYRSGSTLNEIAKVLKTQGKVRNIYVITITKTRSNR
jgi:predicted amidophosphoribosyltransferase